MTFEERHAQVDEDPLVELKRRLQPWASAPDSWGQPLNAAIVPTQTIADAIALLEQHREMVSVLQRAKTVGSA